MEPVPVDFLEDLAPQEPPKSKMVNAWRWGFICFLGTLVLLYVSSLLRLQKQITWLGPGHFLARSVVIMFSLVCMVQLLRSKRSGWILSVVLAVDFLCGDLIKACYVGIGHWNHPRAMYTIMLDGIFGLVNLGLLIVFLGERGMAYWGVKATTRTWVLIIALLAAIPYFVFYSYPTYALFK